MRDRHSPVRPSDRDLLVSRPNRPLPTTEDPSGPRARGYPSDPKPRPAQGQGVELFAQDIGYTA